MGLVGHGYRTTKTTFTKTVYFELVSPASLLKILVYKNGMKKTMLLAQPSGVAEIEKFCKEK